MHAQATLLLAAVISFTSAQDTMTVPEDDAPWADIVFPTNPISVNVIRSRIESYEHDLATDSMYTSVAAAVVDTIWNHPNDNPKDLNWSNELPADVQTWMKSAASVEASLVTGSAAEPNLLRRGTKSIQVTVTVSTLSTLIIPVPTPSTVLVPMPAPTVSATNQEETDIEGAISDMESDMEEMLDNAVNRIENKVDLLREEWILLQQAAIEAHEVENMLEEIESVDEIKPGSATFPNVTYQQIQSVYFLNETEIHKAADFFHTIDKILKSAASNGMSRALVGVGVGAAGLLCSMLLI